MATLAQQWIKEGIERGIEKGTLENAREMSQEAISLRFGTAPEDIAGEIERFEDGERLRVLLRQAVVCRDGKHSGTRLQQPGIEGEDRGGGRTGDAEREEVGAASAAQPGA